MTELITKGKRLIFSKTLILLTFVLITCILTIIPNQRVYTQEIIRRTGTGTENSFTPNQPTFGPTIQPTNNNTGNVDNIIDTWSSGLIQNQPGVQNRFDVEGDPETGLVGCKGTDCDFDSLMEMIRKIINFAITVAISVVAIIIAYAGFIYMTAGGDSSKISQAHGMFKKSAIGFLVVLSAFLIVKLILDQSGATDDSRNQLQIELKN